MLGCKFLFSCKLTRGQATSEGKYYLAASAMKNPPAVQEMQDTWVQSLGWKDSLEKMTTYPCSCLGKNPMDKGAWQTRVHGVAKSQTRLNN